MSTSLIRKKQINFSELQPSDLPFLIENGGAVAIDYNGDYELTPLSTTGGTISVYTGLSPTLDPLKTETLSSAFYVLVNGVSIDLADGPDQIFESYGYFSIDSGSSSQYIADIGSQSYFYWNPSIAGYDLDPLTDTITFQYEIGQPLLTVGPTGAQGEQGIGVTGSTGATGATGPGSSSFIISASKNGIVANISPSEPSGQFLEMDGSYTNEAPFVLFDDFTLTAISMSAKNSTSWNAEIYVNNFTLGSPQAVVSLVSNTQYYMSALSLSLSSGDKIAIRCQTISTDVDSPRINLFFIE